jgi:hypothetical protein
MREQHEVEMKELKEQYESKLQALQSSLDDYKMKLEAMNTENQQNLLDTEKLKRYHFIADLKQ